MLKDGYHNVESCLEISNLSDYPDYTFYATIDYKFPGAEQMYEGGICGLLGSGSIIAVKNSDRSKIVKSDDAEQAGGWPDLAANNAYVVRSQEVYAFEGQLPDADTTVKESRVVRIDDVSATGVDTTLLSFSREDEAGKSTSMTAEDNTVLYAKIVAVALGVAGLVFCATKWKK
jgi:hypothetical protein